MRYDCTSFDAATPTWFRFASSRTFATDGHYATAGRPGPLTRPDKQQLPLVSYPKAAALVIANPPDKGPILESWGTFQVLLGP